MNREQIIQMALEAGGFYPRIYHPSSPEPRISISNEQLEAFADAIRAATKEEDAKICENMANEKEATPEQEFALDLASDAIRASK